MSDPFASHGALLRTFLQRRAEVVDCIDRLLNCQKKPVEFQQDFALLSRQFKDCFFTLQGLGVEEVGLRDQLERAHWASGFKPRAQPGNDLVDPVEQMLRAFHMWRQTHWPGQKGRIRFAHTLFNLYVVRSLALLCMRLWDAEGKDVPARLAQLQAILDELWRGAPADQPQLVRDVRWLFPVAMSPTTDSLAGYFVIAQRIAETFSDEDRVETQKAWVQTGAGHLRSQLRDLAQRRDLALDARELVLLTRMSNALDVALLVEGLVSLLAAYEQSLHGGDVSKRLELAAAICQGLSPDPELFVVRLDLLGPYTMIEHLFITTDDTGRAVYTTAGQRHTALLHDYRDLIARLAQPLYDDLLQGTPDDAAWSPYGALYGFASNLLELIAFKTLARDAATHFSMEDVFTTGGADKLAWVNGWRQLPHIKPELVRQFDYPADFAAAIRARIERALQQRVSGAVAQHSGRLFVVTDAVAQQDAELAQVPALPAEYVVASDAQLIAAHKATAKDQDDLLHCRNEGEFLVSYPTAYGWVGLTKDLLTGVLGEGRDAKVAGLPRSAAEVLQLMCIFIN